MLGQPLLIREHEKRVGCTTHLQSATPSLSPSSRSLDGRRWPSVFSIQDRASLAAAGVYLSSRNLRRSLSSDETVAIMVEWSRDAHSWAQRCSGDGERGVEGACAARTDVADGRNKRSTILMLVEFRPCVLLSRLRALRRCGFQSWGRRDNQVGELLECVSSVWWL